jgi:hypothetical protein
VIHLYPTHPGPSTPLSVWVCLVIVSALEFVAVNTWMISRKVQDSEEVEYNQLLAGVVLLFSVILGSFGVVPWAVLQPMFLLATFAEGGPW